MNNTVVWTNYDSVPHTVTSNDGSFSSGNLNPGDTYQFTYATPGTYTYHCSYHPILCADKAYLSRKICKPIAKCGGEPYISIKKNIVKVRSKGSRAWKEMLFLYRRSKKLYLKKITGGA